MPAQRRSSSHAACDFPCICIICPYSFRRNVGCQDRQSFYGPFAAAAVSQIMTARRCAADSAVKRGVGILRGSTALMKSITFEVAGTEIVMGSNRDYAVVQKFGTAIASKAMKALASRIGGGVVHSESVTILALPHLRFGRTDGRRRLSRWNRRCRDRWNRNC